MGVRVAAAARTPDRPGIAPRTPPAAGSYLTKSPPLRTP